MLFNTNGRNYTEEYKYNQRGQVGNITYSGAINRSTTFTYVNNAAGDLQEITTGGFKYRMTYDTYNRPSSEVIKNSAGAIIEGRSITYRKVNDHATNMVAQLLYGDNCRINYAYDTMGNIGIVRQNNLLLARYKYDGLNRLVREDNQAFGETYLYTYDSNGNILSKEIQPFTTAATLVAGTGTVTSYFYNTKDQLQSLDGHACVYDAVGNPTSYRGNTLTWTRGRKLVSYGNVQFTYNAQGKRMSKNAVDYYYNSDGKLIGSSDGMQYFYGATGLIGFTYGGNRYVYRKNLQGDIIAILDSTGTIVVQYVYDAWGESLAMDTSGNVITDLSHIGQKNPFRYRGYFYDVETGLYYLNTRYYDPAIGRFINIDSITYAEPSVINGLNLYVYCGNNPVMDIDPDGTWSWKTILKAVVAVAVVVVAVAVSVASAGTVTGAIAAGATIGAAVGGTVSAATAYQEAKEEGKTGEELWEAVVDKASTGMLTGAASGALAASPVGLSGQILGNMLISGTEYVATGLIDGKELNPVDFGVSVIAGGIGGLVGGKGALTTATGTKFAEAFWRQTIINNGRQLIKDLTYSITMGTISGTLAGMVDDIMEKVVDLFN